MGRIAEKRFTCEFMHPINQHKQQQARAIKFQDLDLVFLLNKDYYYLPLYLTVDFEGLGHELEARASSTLLARVFLF